MTYKSKRIWAPVLGALLVSGLAAAGQDAPVDNRPGRIRVSQGVAQKNLIKKVQPVYPEAARKVGVEGSVILAAIIAENGTMQEVKLKSGDPLLAPAAIDAVKQWVYNPYLLNGEPIEVETTITVAFRLQPASSTPGGVLLVPPPLEGTLDGSQYNNPKLGLALTLPAGWKPVQLLAGGYTPAKSYDKLLAAGEGPETWLLVSGFQDSRADATAKVGAYLVWGQELQAAGYSVEPKTQEIKVGGKKLFRLSYEGRAGQTTAHCSLFITTHNKHVFLLEFCASSRPVLDSVVTAVQTLSFTKTNK